MSFSVQLYKHDKRDNSTLRPDGDGWQLYCVLRRGSSIMTPVLEFDFGTTADGNPIDYNYCYMPSFNRYYFIEDWTYSGSLWIATCIVDVLATYKDEIGGTSLYMLRASAASDGRVPDTMYPAKEGCTFSHEYLECPYTLTNGTVILGVVDEDPTIGGLSYYNLSMSTAHRLMNALLNNNIINDTNGFNTTDASAALQRSIADPIQYVKSAIYFPFALDVGTSKAFNINGWTSLGSQLTGSKAFTASQSNHHLGNVFTIPKHPDAARGEYLNQAPWSNYTMTIPPFGQVELDSSILANATTVGAAVDVDLVTGLGILTISANGVVISRIEAQVGVPIQLSQVSRDYLGAITSIMQGAAGVVSGAMAGPAGIASGIGSGIGAIGDAVKALVPRAQTVGSGGSFSQLRYDWRLDAQFFRPVDEDNAHNGRPLCAMRTPASLGGYMLVRDGDVSTGGTSAEDARVREYLETGFYYE